LLLKKKVHLLLDEEPRLKRLFELNLILTTVYILKDSLKKLWNHLDPA